MSQCLIIIPAFNEEENIIRTIETIKKTAPDFDYIVINDCSTDRTRDLLEEEQIPHINLPVNLGIGGAVQAGYQYAWKNGYEMAVQMDGDGQHIPGYLKKMACVLTEEKADLVIGSRFLEKKGYQSSFIRRMGIRYFSWLIFLCTGKKITDPTSGQRMVGRRLIGKFAEHYPQDYPEPETIVMALRDGYRFREIPVEMQERKGGKSSIGFIDAIYYMIKVTMAIWMETVKDRKNVK